MNCIIFGGSGYVGTHLINYLLNEKEIDYEKIIISDLKFPDKLDKDILEKVHYINCDVRNSIAKEEFIDLKCSDNTIIYNLAAICRIPGFPNIDYYRTNILGAESICELAEELGCKKIVFTSSVSPYGASEELKNEESIPQPIDPYGGSKMAAEYIHKGWQKKDSENRMLSILRPGIIFGKNEQANFTRLYKLQKKGFFIYPGRKDTKKACVYVKDVVRACYHFSKRESGQHIFNTVYKTSPRIDEICLALAEFTDAKKPLFKVPGAFIMFFAYCINLLGKIIGKEFIGIHPDRVKKVMISTNISGEKLDNSDFNLKYSLEEGIIDWFKDCNGKLY